jgi:Dopey, N-terminal
MEDELLLNEKQKIEMVESMLVLLLKRDLSVTRRIYSWCFGEPDLDNNYVMDETRSNVI